MLEILLMDEEINQQICDLILYAEANPFDKEQMLFAQNNKTMVIPKETYDNYVIMLPYDIRVVYTVEEHPVGICKHISLSQNNEIPSFDDCVIVLDLFGFVGFKKQVGYVYPEACTINGEECKALNVIEPLF